MEDLAESRELGRLLTIMLDDDKVIAAVCHGPAALLSAERDGSWAFAGRELSAFTDEEETQAGLAGNARWLLEDRLREAGGNMATGSAWEPLSVVDGNVVTGQNPRSSTEVAQRPWSVYVPGRTSFTSCLTSGRGRTSTSTDSCRVSSRRGRRPSARRWSMPARMMTGR
jgi:hypothetical protein